MVCRLYLLLLLLSLIRSESKACFYYDFLVLHVLSFQAMENMRISELMTMFLWAYETLRFSCTVSVLLCG